MMLHIAVAHFMAPSANECLRGRNSLAFVEHPGSGDSEPADSVDGVENDRPESVRLCWLKLTIHSGFVGATKSE